MLRLSPNANRGTGAALRVKRWVLASLCCTQVRLMRGGAAPVEWSVHEECTLSISGTSPDRAGQRIAASFFRQWRMNTQKKSRSVRAAQRL